MRQDWPVLIPCEKPHNTDLFRALFDQAATGIICISLDGVIGAANNHAAHLLGYEPAELIGTPFTDLVHPEDQYPSLDSIDELHRERTVFEKRLIREDSETIVSKLATSLIENGSDSFRMCVVEDLTDQKAEEGRQQMLREYPVSENADQWRGQLTMLQNMKTWVEGQMSGHNSTGSV